MIALAQDFHTDEGPTLFRPASGPDTKDQTIGGGGSDAGEGASGDVLRSIEPFRDLPADRLADVAELVSVRRVLRGEPLFHLGDPSDALYLVATGRFHVFPKPDADPVAEISNGEPVGELAFLTGRPRTASVVAARDSEVVEISRASYDRLRACAPLLQQGLLERLAHRMQMVAPAARPMARTPARTIALCRIGDAPIPGEIVDRLASAMSAFGRTEIVGPELVGPELVGPELVGPELARECDGALEAAIANLERDCDFVLCIVDHARGEAARRLLRHCDAVVMIASLAEPPRDMAPIVRDCGRLFLKRDRSLILWRAGSGEPITGSADRVGRADVELHHQVALGKTGDIERVARFIAGRALGAVFGGGGALGCGHLGVARAFRDAGGAFDIYGGTSAGAAMALALAGDVSPEEVMDRIEHTFVEKRAMRRFTLPVFSFLDHTVFDRELSAHYGDRDLADLPINGFAVSTNLSRNRLHVHRTGSIWHAVRSSGAIPGVLPPFVDRSGEMFVDGALIDNLPLSTMRDIKLGPNVVAGFFDDDTRKRHLRYDEIPGRERLIGDIVMRRRRTFPGLLNVLTRSMMVTSRRSVSELEIGADCLMRLPACKGMGMLDWKTGRAQEELCYQFACRRIEEAGGVDRLVETDV